MRILICLVTLLLTTVLGRTTPVDYKEVNQWRFIQDAIIGQLFEMGRKLIISGDSENGVRVMDPMQFDYSEKHFDGSIFRIDAYFTNSSLTGLGNFMLLKSDFDKKDLSIDMDFVFPSLLFESDHYEMDGNLFGAVPLAGEGKMQIELLDVRFWGKVYLKQSEDGKSILLDKFENANFRVNKVSSHMDFDGNIDEIFNAMIEELIPHYLNRFSKFFVNVLSDMLIDTFNPVLNLYETWRIIVIILY